MNKVSLRWAVAVGCSMFMCLPLAAETPWTVSLHTGMIDIDRQIQSDGIWWSEVSDDNTMLGISVTYDFSPMLSLRLMYEQADDFSTVNACPPNAVCPAVLITEQQDFDAWQLALMPRYDFSPDWSGFVSLGIQNWELKRDQVLPGDSGTTFIYGLGVGWKALERFELSLEYQRSNVDYEAYRLGLGFRF